ncbi:hypothetical protein L6452_22128 [Arctium lappa]|uniref:Uncharacterized protein n=1 Tax=Arctium lappa TaxID=4217 RepID=A0ACB9B0M0_ARCLA|nr:hypothetical protein L6452_22128 [Arctium lappa]
MGRRGAMRPRVFKVCGARLNVSDNLVVFFYSLFCTHRPLCFNVMNKLVLVIYKFYVILNPIMHALLSYLYMFEKIITI